METIQFEYLKLIAAYMLHTLVESQSMDSADPRPRDHGVSCFTFHQLCMPPSEQQYLEGQGFSCLRSGYVGPQIHV